MIYLSNIFSVYKENAVNVLMGELNKGISSVKSEQDWISEDDIFSEFDINI